MLSMNGIIACELILGVVWMGLIFMSFADTDLIADRSSMSENETKADGFRTATKQTDLRHMYMRIVAVDYWVKKTGAAPFLLASKPSR